MARVVVKSVRLGVLRQQRLLAVGKPVGVLRHVGGADLQQRLFARVRSRNVTGLRLETRPSPLELACPLRNTAFGAGLLCAIAGQRRPAPKRSEEHTSELQSLMRISYAVFCLKKKN